MCYNSRGKEEKGMKKQKKLFSGVAEIMAITGTSRTKSQEYLKEIEATYKIDRRRCLKGKVPTVLVEDFFNFKPEKKN